MSEVRLPVSGCWCWVSRDGMVHRGSQGSDAHAFEYWDCRSKTWIPTNFPGVGPWTPCEDPSVDREPRVMRTEVRRWLMEHPMEELRRENGTRIRWSPGRLQYQSAREGSSVWVSSAADNGPWAWVVPVREEGW